MQQRHSKTNFFFSRAFAAHFIVCARRDKLSNGGGVQDERGAQAAHMCAWARTDKAVIGASEPEAVNYARDIREV